MICAPDDTGRRIQLSAAKARAPSSQACLLAQRIYCNRIAAAAHAQVDPIVAAAPVRRLSGSQLRCGKPTWCYASTMPPRDLKVRIPSSLSCRIVRRVRG
jgi:hypothetical protein